MRVDLEKFRERLAAFDDEVVLEMAPAVIAEIEYLRAEIARLREALRRLTEQDATLSAVDGNVIVEMDAITDEEVAMLKAFRESDYITPRGIEIIDGLLERLGEK